MDAVRPAHPLDGLLHIQKRVRPPTGFVYAEGEYLMLNGERFLVKGYNYLPRDYGWTSLADWDWEEAEEVL